MGREKATRKTTRQIKAKPRSRTNLVSQQYSGVPESEFRTLFEHVPDGVYRSSPDGRLLAANPALVRMFGYVSEVELLRVDIARQLYSDPDQRRVELQRIDAEGELVGNELVLTRKDGTRLTVLDSAHAVRGRDGRVVFYEGTLTDITDRKRAEEELARQNAILDAVAFAADRFLRTGSWEEQIDRVLERLGKAAQVGRVHIFENRSDAQGNGAWHRRYEWVAPNVVTRIDSPVVQNFVFGVEGVARWIQILQNGGLIAGHVKDLPLSEQGSLAAKDVKSILCAPIMVQQACWGFIRFDECIAEREWSPAVIDASRTAAEILGAAIEREQADQELRLRAEHLASLNEITHTALALPDLNQMLQRLAEQLGTMLKADACYITLWDEEHQRTTPLVAHGPLSETYATMATEPGEVTMTMSVLNVGHALIAEDVFNSPFISAQLARRFPGRSLMGLPLIAGNHKLGAALVSFMQRHQFTDSEITRATQAAGQIALALAKAFALQAEQQRVTELEAVRQASLSLTAKLDFPSVLGAIVECTLNLTPGASDAHIYLYQDNQLRFGTSLWTDGRKGEEWSVPRSDGLTFTVARSGKTIVIPDMQRHPIFATTPWSGAIIGIPLKIAERIVGVMTIACKEPRTFSENELRTLDLLAAQAAIATENAALYDEVQQMALTDSLTGAYNRRGFFQIGESELERARRFGSGLSVLMFDLDHFKRVNDTYGHPFGDKVLAALMETCRRHIRTVDILGRYGGEEFAALLPEANATMALQIAERVREAVERTSMQIDGIAVAITISIGVTTLTDPGTDLRRLLHHADQALYCAKQAGRNRVHLYESQATHPGST